MGFSRVEYAVGAGALLLAFSSGLTAADVPRFASRSDLVVLSATAADRHGRPVTNLRPEEFRVFEDGRPQALVHFAQGTSAPARLLLLVDASGSMSGPLQSDGAREAVARILAELQPEDETALAGFDQRYHTVVPFTRARQAVLQGLDRLERFGSTALHDAVDSGARELAAREGRRALVVVTDGVDTASALTAEAVLDRARALDVPIYALSVVSPLDDPASRRYAGAERRPAAAVEGAAQLARYALLSGGASFTASDALSLQRAAVIIASELKHQYRLGYDPPAGPSRFRRVEVQTTRKGVVVRTRSGYFPRT